MQIYAIQNMQKYANICKSLEICINMHKYAASPRMFVLCKNMQIYAKNMQKICQNMHHWKSYAQYVKYAPPHFAHGPQGSEPPVSLPGAKSLRLSLSGSDSHLVALSLEPAYTDASGPGQVRFRVREPGAPAPSGSVGWSESDSDSCCEESWQITYMVLCEFNPSQNRQNLPYTVWNNLPYTVWNTQLNICSNMHIYVWIRWYMQ